MFINLINKLHIILSLLTDINVVKAFLTWPKFSITSCHMVTCLAKQGILPNTVIDVGANVGQFTIATSKIFGDIQIYSFEPLPACAQELQRNVYGIRRIVVYPFALGETEGDTRFYINSHTQSSSVLPLTSIHCSAFPKAQEEQITTVKISTLDLVFANIEFQHPVLLKVDVQGYEAQVLLGGEETLRRVDFVIVEVSFKTMYKGELIFRDVLRAMEARGFRFDRPVGSLANPSNGEVMQMDALFTRSV